ncbi:MAG: uracil phosphoribosyltransferase [Firmicutes bacterium]|nr:uracil phosphoribosyltransferase [Bacillota bacterium]
MSELIIAEHPLVQSKLALLRDKNTNKKEFRELVAEITSLLCYEAMKNTPVKDVEIETPYAKVQAKELSKQIGVAAVLRGGLGMVDGVVRMVPNARIGHIGLYRDPGTFTPIEYYCKLPEAADDIEMLLLEPMTATGGTASAAVTFLKERGFKSIKYLSLISTPEGVKKLQEDHPDVDVFTAALDRQVSEDGYIIPGLGDAGERMFGTK